MFKASPGSTKRLIQLCIAYFVFYVITGITVKYFQGKPALGFPGLKAIEFLVYSTLGGQFICLAVVLVRRWYRFESQRLVRICGFNIPVEFLYIIPSGICTAVVIPTTTLMYSLPISVMVAMIIMRGAVIIISRFVDAIQIHQGILKKKVYAEENIAVLFAIAAICMNIFFARKGDLEFVRSVAAMSILGSYIVAYTIRIYIMNYYRNTTGRGAKGDNRSFFAIEQIAAGFTILIVAILLFKSPTLFGWTGQLIQDYRNAFVTPRVEWPWAILAGMAFGMVAFFSVFLFMFKGRTATFNGLVNRLTSLVAGTVATLIFCVCCKGKFPNVEEWLSLALILISVIFLTRSERKRAAELIKTHEIEAK